MGKGDRKTAKGKRYNASYGNARSHTASKVAVGAVSYTHLTLPTILLV